MTRILAETKIPERFTVHDLRGNVGSDPESLEHARQPLGHADSKITEKVYRREKLVGRVATAPGIEPAASWLNDGIYAII